MDRHEYWNSNVLLCVLSTNLIFIALVWGPQKDHVELFFRLFLAKAKKLWPYSTHEFSCYVSFSLLCIQGCSFDAWVDLIDFWGINQMNQKNQSHHRYSKSHAYSVNWPDINTMHGFVCYYHYVNKKRLLDTFAHL